MILAGEAFLWIICGILGYPVRVSWPETTSKGNPEIEKPPILRT